MTEAEAIELFTKMFNGSYSKLSPTDVDYKVFDEKGTLIAYVNVVKRVKSIHNAYPLPVKAKGVTKLLDKRLNPTIIWACEDGIIYGKLEKIRGVMFYSPNDFELMCYYDKQSAFRYVRYS